MRSLATLSALLCALGSSAALGAQQQTTSMAIHVVDASNAPVAGARLELVGTRVHGVSGDSGWVRLQRVPAGSAYLRVTRIGYAPMETIVQLAAGTPFEADVELARAPVAVNPVTASAPQQNPALSTSGFYTRKQRGFGVFMDENDIARSGAHRTSDIFRRISGVRVLATEGNKHKLQSVRYGMSSSEQDAGAFSAFQNNGAGGGVQRRSPDDPADAKNARVCEMLTIVNGVPVKLEDLDELHLDNIGAVEVYRGASEVPAEFNQTGAACGVVVIWTRDASPSTNAATPAPAPASPPPAP